VRNKEAAKGDRFALDVTCAICTRNSAGRIERVLRALAAQRVGVDAAPGNGAGRPSDATPTWEALLIDNASTEGTGEVAARCAGALGLALRVVREERPGLSFARMRAAAAARGRILSFIDDDNLVREDWVRAVAGFMDGHPRAGIVGGRILAEFEDPATRPFDFDEHYARALACWDLGDADQRYQEPVHYPPCGAGLTLRTAVLRGVLEHCGMQLTGRRGGRLVSGEDYEIDLLILKLGWEAWYTPRLEMRHVLPPGRLSGEYLRRLRIGNFQSERWLNYLRDAEGQLSRRELLVEWARNKWRGWKFDQLARVRKTGHSDSKEYPFWAEASHLKAAGAWQLLTKYPYGRVQRGLEMLRRDPSMVPPAGVAGAAVVATREGRR
jgi:glycosyltransferase involved in cell wall biosynthesis